MTKKAIDAIDAATVALERELLDEHFDEPKVVIHRRLRLLRQHLGRLESALGEYIEHGGESLYRSHILEAGEDYENAKAGA